MNGAGFSFVVGPGEDGMTARGTLRRVRGVSQRLVRKIAHGEGEGAGALYVNGRPARFNDRVKAGDEIRLVFPMEKSWIEPEDIPLTVLYEDDDILVIDKQPGLVVHPTKGHREGTLAGAIIYYMRQRGESYKPHFISRLDMDTSGVLLVGKNSHAQDSLAKQTASGGVEKYYTVVLEGRLEDDLPPSGAIDLPIGLERPGEPRRAVLTEEGGGVPSRTEYEVLETLSYDAGSGKWITSSLSASRNDTDRSDEEGSFRAASNDVDRGGEGGLFRPARNDDESEDARSCQCSVLTVVRARLITGRTHQIRVHFAHFGHPVLGDQLYGRATPLIGRQALHATELVFAHPATGEPLRIVAPLPGDMAAFAGKKD